MASEGYGYYACIASARVWVQMASMQMIIMAIGAHMAQPVGMHNVLMISDDWFPAVASCAICA